MTEKILNDRELLELAAKAAGIALIPYTWNKGTGWDHEGFTVAGEGPNEWSPLYNDGQALRLAVKLHLHRAIAEAHRLVDDKTDIYAATLRAIVRAAAAIGAAK